ncbi:MAG: hypothetical protein ACRENS_05465 [Candidatus Eiseniibacteriota bacterium]
MTHRSLIIMVAVIIDLIITCSVLTLVLKRRGLIQMFTTNLEKSRAFAAEARGLAGNFIRANYSGNPDDLPALLEQLMVQLEQKASERGMKLQRPMLKLILAQALRAEDGVAMSDLNNAMRKVA